VAEGRGLVGLGEEAILVATYRESLRRAGLKFVVSFEMLDEKGHDQHLFFGTAASVLRHGHRAGLEKTKRAMWTVDPIGGVRFRDPRDPTRECSISPSTPTLDP
jgi:hypothetical protein